MTLWSVVIVQILYDKASTIGSDNGPKRPKKAI